MARVTASEECLENVQSSTHWRLSLWSEGRCRWEYTDNTRESTIEQSYLDLPWLYACWQRPTANSDAYAAGFAHTPLRCLWSGGGAVRPSARVVQDDVDATGYRSSASGNPSLPRNAAWFCGHTVCLSMVCIWLCCLQCMSQAGTWRSRRSCEFPI